MTKPTKTKTLIDYADARGIDITASCRRGRICFVVRLMGWGINRYAGSLDDAKGQIDGIAAELASMKGGVHG